MKNISLLPAEIKQYHNSAKRRNLVIMAGLLAIVAFTAAYLGLSLVAAKPQNELMSIKRERAELQQKISGLKQYENEVNNAKALEALINVAMGNNPDWNRLLVDIFNSMPEDVRIEGFTTTYESNTGSLNITGKSSSNGKLSEWLSKLQEVKGLADVECKSSSKEGTDNGSSVRYEITATILQGSNYALKEIGGEADE